MTERRRSVATPVLVLVGTAMAVWGVIGVFADPDNTHPPILAGWVVGADLVHDLALVPVVSAVAWLIGRTVPSWARPAVRWSLAVSGLLVVVGWPFIAGYGRNPSVPSLLGRNYATGVAAYVAALVALGVVWAARRRRNEWRARAAGSGEAGGPGVLR